MLIKQVCQNNAIFVTIGIWQILILGMNCVFAMVVTIWWKKAMSFNNVAIVYVKRSSYIIHFWYISKDDATNIMNGSNLADKQGVL